MAIISHGANKLGGFNYNGSQQNTLPDVSSSEYDNVYTTTADMDNNLTSKSYNYEFDDIVSYKTKSQLIFDAGMQYIICSGNESAITSNGHNLSWANALYNNSVSTTGCSTPTNLSRTCGQYGIWSSIGCTT